MQTDLRMLAADFTSAPQAELQATGDLKRHQEALDVVSTFAAQMHEHMQTCTDGQAVTQGPEVLQACCEVAGVLVTSAPVQNNLAYFSLLLPLLACLS